MISDIARYLLLLYSTLSPLQQSFLNTFLDNGVRSDGRLFSACRPTTIITSGVLTRNAAGSALATIGSTQVMAAVSLQVGIPAAGYAENGDLVVTSPLHATWLERVLVESKMIDLNSLSIVPARAAWRLQVVVMVLNDDGNVRDTMLLAAVAALRNTILPKTVVDKNGVVSLVDENEEDGKDITKGTTEEQSLCATSTDIPIPLTVGFIRDNNSANETRLLVDPNAMEEKLCDSSCCMVMNASSGEVANCDLQGTISISSQQLALVAQMAKGRAKELVDIMTN